MLMVQQQTAGVPSCYGVKPNGEMLWDPKSSECAGGHDPSFTDANGGHIRRKCQFFESCGAKVQAAKLQQSGVANRLPLIPTPMGPGNQAFSQFVQQQQLAAPPASPPFPTRPSYQQQQMWQQQYQQQQQQQYMQQQQMMYGQMPFGYAPMMPVNYQMPAYLSMQEPCLPGESVWRMLGRSIFRSMGKSVGHTVSHFFDSTVLAVPPQLSAPQQIPPQPSPTEEKK